MATSIWKIRYPFDGHYHVTFPFGATSSNEHINHKLTQLQLKGHSGLDFGLPVGTNVYAVYDGIVTHAGDLGSYGKTITIKHSWGESLYAHLSEILVSIGKEIKESDHIGLSGDTGYTFGPHLHFAIRPSEYDEHNGFHGYIDPQPYFALHAQPVPEKTNSLIATVECFIERDGKFLMHKRAADKHIMPGIILPPGGKCNKAEGVVAAVRREILEETGLHVTGLRLKAVGNMVLKDIQQELCIHIFFAKAEDGDVVESSQDGTFMWMTPDEIRTNELVLSEIKKIHTALFDTTDTIVSFSGEYSNGNTLDSFVVDNPAS